MDNSYRSSFNEERQLTMHRVLFCAYFLYFTALRSLFGENRFLDYMGIFFLVFGLLHLIYNRQLNGRLVRWISILMSPMLIAVILEPSMHAFIFLFKSYLIAVYFTCYFRLMRLSIVELVCFTIPVILNVYFFVFPKAEYYQYLILGRMAGISEPNFTSLSLIISMCGAIGIYMLSDIKRVKVSAMVTALVCFCGVFLTISRGGFIASTIALCLFLLMRKRILSVVGVVMTVITLMWIFSIDMAMPNNFLMIDRLKSPFERANTTDELIHERFFTEHAWHVVQNGEWFKIGIPESGEAWNIEGSSVVSHNSFLDIGIEFGKASFYSSCALFFILLAINIRVVLRNWRCRDIEEKFAMLTPLLFLSLIPMYMTLSTGMTMIFILWVVLGAYPLLHATQDTSMSNVDALNPNTEFTEDRGFASD